MLIKDVIVTELRQIDDDRGAVLHMMRPDTPGYGGFGECYFSEVLPGVVKAWKLHKLQTQNIAVPVGRVRFVIFDGRDNSETKGQIQVLELGRPDDYVRITVPPGLWYGFECVSDTPALLANCADIPHDPTESEVMSLEDSFIPYSWDEGGTS